MIDCAKKEHLWTPKWQRLRNDCDSCGHSLGRGRLDDAASLAWKGGHDYDTRTNRREWRCRLCDKVHSPSFIEQLNADIADSLAENARQTSKWLLGLKNASGPVWVGGEGYKFPMVLAGNPKLAEAE